MLDACRAITCVAICMQYCLFSVQPKAVQQLPCISATDLCTFWQLIISPKSGKSVLCRFEFPQQLDMYKYTVEGLAEAEQAEALGPEAPSPSPSPSPPQSPPKAKQKYQYKLKGIVVHSGTAFAGHYYSFIKVTCPVFAAKRISRAVTLLATPNISPENSSWFLLISVVYASMPGVIRCNLVC